MKTERAPCEGAPSPTQTSYPLSFVKDGQPDRPSSSSVTSSTFAIQSPSNVRQLETTGKKKKDYRLGWLVWHTTKNKDLSPMNVRMLNLFVLEGLHSTDNKIIISTEEMAELLETSEKVIRQSRDRLIALNLIRLLLKGYSIPKGGRVCSEYALGSGFDGVRPIMRGKGKIPHNHKAKRGYSTTPLKEDGTGVLEIQKGGVRIPPSPISTPHTHTQELPLAFSKENWDAYCFKLNSTREQKDIDRTFDKALIDGATSENWESYAKVYDSHYKPSTKAAPAPSPKIWHKQPCKPQRSHCESPRLEPLDYTQPEILQNQIYTALKEGLSIRMIKANADPAQYEEAYRRAEASLLSLRSEPLKHPNK